MAAVSGEPATVPFLPGPQPDAAPVGGVRCDERGPEDFRAVFLRTGVVSQAAGSAYLELGGTKVMAGVYGPRPTERREVFSKEGHVSVDVKLASFATRARGRIQQTPAERELSAQAATALGGAVRREAFPKAVVDVHVVVLEADGGELAAAVTAGSAALADAGVPMVDLVSAVTLARIGGELLLDPCGAEQAQQEAAFSLAAMPTADLVTGALLTGEWKGDSAREGLALALGAAAQLDAVMREALREAAASAAT